jgi:hypothetical protein
MKNQVKKFGQFVNENVDSDMNSFGTRPKVGDTVFAVGFAFDGRELMNNYAGYGTVTKANSNRYSAEFGRGRMPECYDSSGTNENAPEIIFFTEEDIVHYENGVVGVYLKDFLSMR